MNNIKGILSVLVLVAVMLIVACAPLAMMDLDKDVYTTSDAIAMMAWMVWAGASCMAVVWAYIKLTD